MGLCEVDIGIISRRPKCLTKRQPAIKYLPFKVSIEAILVFRSPGIFHKLLVNASTVKLHLARGTDSHIIPRSVGKSFLLHAEALTVLAFCFAHCVVEI